MDEFLSRVVERTKKIRVGDPMNPDTQMGALISEEHLHKVLDYVELGKKEVRLLYEWGTLTFKLPRSDCNISSLAATLFLVN